MIVEIQLEIDGPWIPLLRAVTSMDLTISEGERILRAGLAGVRVKYDGGSIAMTVRRYAPDAKQFLWQSSSMATPAFENWR